MQCRYLTTTKFDHMDKSARLFLSKAASSFSLHFHHQAKFIIIYFICSLISCMLFYPTFARIQRLDGNLVNVKPLRMLHFIFWENMGIPTADFWISLIKLKDADWLSTFQKWNDKYLGYIKALGSQCARNSHLDWRGGRAHVKLS